MGGVPSTFADRNQVEDRSTAIEVAVRGLVTMERPAPFRSVVDYAGESENS